MAIPAENAQVYRLLPISFWPGQWRLAAIAEKSRVTIASCGVTSTRTAGMVGMKYKNWELKKQFLVEEYGEYVFGYMEDGGDDAVIFVFNPPISDEQRRTPIKPTKWISAARPWPAVLEDLQVVLGPNQVPVMRRAYQEAVTTGSDIRVKEYVSDTPFKRRRIRTNEPIPGEVDADFYGAKLNVPECLHPRVEVPNRDSDGAELVDLTPTRSGPRPGAKRIYPATNHPRWKAHIFNVEVNEIGELFHLIEMKVFPPKKRPTQYG